MSFELDFLLKKSEENLEKALSVEKSKPASAREHYLIAAEYLLEAAKLSKGEMKEIRMARADKILSRAESLSVEKKRDGSKGDRLDVSDEAGVVEAMALYEISDVSFEDVAGLEDVKEQIKLRLVYPYTNPDVAAEYGIKTGGGLLLYGPPGTGKTYIAKAVAHEINAAFFSIKPSNIMSQWVGVAEKNIAKLFKTAREQERAVIFVDEVDALLPRRRSNYSTVMKRVVPELLAEMEGVDTNNDNVLFLGATNEPWEIDDAAMRPGRFDKKIYIPPPDMAAREQIFRLNLQDRLIDPDINYSAMAEVSEGYSGADIVEICIEAAQRAYMEYIKTAEKAPITLETVLSVMEEVKPSITPENLRKYEKFSRQ